MKWQFLYDSPLGKLLLESDERGLTGLRFHDLPKILPEKNRSVFEETLRWLDLYFSGKDPGFLPALHLCGTDFQMEVWKLLLEIPFGQTETYGRIARKIAERRGGRMSAQAVGGAVGRNPVAVIVPCHRVIGSSGELTGYAGGLELKQKLLSLEGIEMIG